jgi:hypothetical protein
LSYAAIYELGKHVDTEFAILVHEDGFIVNLSVGVMSFEIWLYWNLAANTNDDFSYRYK